jgi:hypothetical protein
LLGLAMAQLRDDIGVEDKHGQALIQLDSLALEVQTRRIELNVCAARNAIH